MKAIGLVATALSAVTASQILACEPVILGPVASIFAFNKPLKTNPDCSFDSEFAYRRHGYSAVASVSGGVVRDLGNGRVAQRVTYAGSCNVTERLVFVDCMSMEFIAIVGEPPDPSLPAAAGLTEKRVVEIQKPRGQIQLGSNSTVLGLAKIAEAQDYDYTRDPNDLLEGLKRRNRFDPFCGCKLFYPDMPGATQ